MRVFTAGLAAIGLCLFGLAAQAAVFPSGPSRTFAFQTTGGILNPGVLVGFNPQPDPPGYGGAQYVPGEGIVAPPTADNTFGFVMSFVGGRGEELKGPDAPNSDGVTHEVFSLFSPEGVAHVFGVTLHFAGPGSASSWTWGAFNPQPDPPGIWFGSEIGFAAGDPSVSFSLTEDGAPLQLSLVPEPGAWVLMLVGVAGLGAAARRLRARAAAIG